MSFSIFCFVLGSRCQRTSAGVPGSLASMLSTNKVYFTCCCWKKYLQRLKCLFSALLLRKEGSTASRHRLHLLMLCCSSVRCSQSFMQETREVLRNISIKELLCKTGSSVFPQTYYFCFVLLCKTGPAIKAPQKVLHRSPVSVQKQYLIL